MRKFIKSLSALCCFAMLCSGLCACSGETEKTVPENTAKIKAEERREVPSAKTDSSDSELPVSPASQDTDNSVSTESENGITITGEPLSSDQLTDFELDYEWAKNYVDIWYVGDFLDGLGDPAFKDLYCRALALARLISTDNIKVSSSVDLSAPAYLDIFNERIEIPDRYMESGYTYDSFYEAFCSVFTQETADIIFSRYPFFYSYNGEMWFIGTSAGGNVGEVFQEYELMSQTDAELEFKRISYSVPIGEPLTDYDPAKKDEYQKTEVEFRFVKTSDGWRAEKFLNATDYNKMMLIA